MITETRERFIRAIVERLPAERIVEAYFFPSIRQGPIETGVAVIAATPVPEPDAPLELDLSEAPTDDPAPLRAEVLTASYRWTRKGADRGKWVVDLTAEAHAPIPTVEAVVRGVQERSGEALDAHRMSGDEIRSTLPVPPDGAVDPAAASAPGAPATPA